jgi:hypothetical protein
LRARGARSHSSPGVFVFGAPQSAANHLTAVPIEFTRCLIFLSKPDREQVAAVEIRPYFALIDRAVEGTLLAQHTAMQSTECMALFSVVLHNVQSQKQRDERRQHYVIEAK